MFKILLEMSRKLLDISNNFPEINFNEIPSIIEMACEKHDFVSEPSLDDILNIEKWSTDFVKSYHSKI